MIVSCYKKKALLNSDYSLCKIHINDYDLSISHLFNNTTQIIIIDISKNQFINRGAGIILYDNKINQFIRKLESPAEKRFSKKIKSFAKISKNFYILENGL